MAKRIDQDLINRIKTEYISCGTDMRTLAEKHGVSFAVIGKWSSKDGWQEKREEFKRELEESLLMKQQEQRLMSVENVNDEDVEGWKLFKQKALLLLMKTDKPIEISHLSQVYEKAQKGTRLALGLDKDDKTVTDLSITVQLPEGFATETESDEDNI